jgi:ATP-binding cassette subfamily F protein uup
MKTVYRCCSKEKTKQKKDWKQNNQLEIWLQRAKEYQKIEKRNQGFRVQKIAIEQLFTDGKVPR